MTVFAPLKLNSRTEKAVYWTLVLTPIWWLLGIQALFYPIVAICLLVKGLSIDKLAHQRLPVAVWFWFAMSLVMLGTAFLGLANTGMELGKIAAQVVAFMKGYFLIFACLALSFWKPLRLCVVTRAVAWMAVGYLVACGILLVFILVGSPGGSSFTPLFASVIQVDAQSLQVDLGGMDKFLGIPMPRTRLYTADPPILGACALLAMLVCLGETDKKLRTTAIVGCSVALLFSFSRLAWICLPVLFLLMAAFRSSRFREALLWLGTAYFGFCGVTSTAPGELFDIVIGGFTQLRPGSSTDRDLVVHRTLEAWQESPMLGWGIIQGSVRWYIYNIALGSFSTYAAVLYLHGIVGFVVFIAALAATAWAYWERAIAGDAFAGRALAGLLVLYMLCAATPLSWMAHSLWFFFVWLGAVLKEAPVKKAAFRFNPILLES
jgi:uncharacterized membrane-anchored protein YitT (DUF2179 family)